MGDRIPVSDEKAQLPEVDQRAIVAADLAWIETDGAHPDKMDAAIRAYLWATRHPAWTLAEWRALAAKGAHDA